MHNISTTPLIVILGAGMSGICMGIQLKKAGIDSFVILEKANGIGGTWWFNTYPGVQCDVHSYLYAFSFEPYWEWNKKFASQQEIQKYLEYCVEKYGLHTHIQLNTEITSAYFQTDSSAWKIQTNKNETLQAKFFIGSSGLLDIPNYPNIKGLNHYKGIVFHSARWDHSFEYANKRIAVIGNAASAVQFIPELAKTVKELFIFQRTANWILPRSDKFYSSTHKQLLRISFLNKGYRYLLYWLHELFRLALNPHNLIATLVTKMAYHHLQNTVQDKILRQQLIPDYPIGCKRVLMSDNYYSTLNQPNVELVTTTIKELGENIIRTVDNRIIEVDAVILATGFKATEILSSIDIKGIVDITLNDLWKSLPKAYYGIAVPSVPNFFLLLGPNTGQGHTSTLIYIEAQAKYIAKVIKEVIKRKSDYVMVKQEAMEAYNSYLQKTLKQSVWAQKCNSWYKAPSGEITAIYPGYSFQYTYALRYPKFQDYIFN